MSSDNRNPPNDDALERFLAGDHELSRLYQDQRDQVQPPPELAARIRNMAAADLQRRPHRRWFVPASAAATVLLGLGITLGLWRDETARHKAMSIPEAPRQSAPTPKPAQPAPVLSPAESDTPKAESAAADDAAPPSAAVAPLAPRKPADIGGNVEPAPIAADPGLFAHESVAPENPAQMPVKVPAAPSPSPPPPPPPKPAAPQARQALRLAQQQADAEIVSRQQAVEESLDKKLAARQMQQRAAPVAASKALSVAGATEHAEPMSAWKAPSFLGLQLGSARREQVHAAFGAPAARGVAMDQAAPVLDTDLPFDFYPQLPGAEGHVELYYARVTMELTAVRVTLATVTRTADLQKQLDWGTPASIRGGDACEASAPTAPDDSGEATASIYPRYWLFPDRGAYWVESEPGFISDIVYEQSCS